MEIHLKTEVSHMAIRFLLVEDNALARMSVTLVLEQAGYEIDTADTGDAGLNMAIDNAYDLILMDFGLGDTDGCEVTKKIRAQSDKNKTTPIVALTAHGEEAYKIKCYDAGMNDFLTKPFDNEKVEYIINKFFNDKS